MNSYGQKVTPVKKNVTEKLATDLQREVLKEEINQGIDKIFKLRPKDNDKRAEVTDGTSQKSHFQNSATATYQGDVPDSNVNVPADSIKNITGDYTIQSMKIKGVR